LTTGLVLTLWEPVWSKNSNELKWRNLQLSTGVTWLADRLLIFGIFWHHTLAEQHSQESAETDRSDF
jgi:hypothetical protein